MESLDMLANNIANAGTDGYKGDREFYNLYVSADAAGEVLPSTMPLIERPWTDLSQGSLRVTGNSLDLALSGKGFFAVNGPSGPLYTRNGAFRITQAGVLGTSEGYSVRGAAGRPIPLQPGQPVDVAADGTVSQNGQAMGRIELADFTAPDALAKQGANYFTAARGVQPSRAAADVQQGKLEGSNVGAAESAVRLIAVMRQFEMLQKAVGIGAEMNRKAVEEVARVGA
jgi:flagellar basal-body rod protein FlgF